MSKPLTGQPLSARARKAYERPRGGSRYIIIKGVYYHGWVGDVLRLLSRGTKRQARELLDEFGPHLHAPILRRARRIASQLPS